MKPILYEQNAFEQNTQTPFTSQGIGVLTDALKCVVTEELNNAYDLEMVYPVGGVHFKDLTLRRIIKAKPNQTDDPQPFRIYKITKPLSGKVTVLAHHLTYDLSGLVVPPFRVNTPGGVIAAITGTAIPTINPFSFINNSTVGANDIQVDKPISARAALGELSGASTIEYSYDKTVIKVVNVRGANKGAVIAYGKNLLDLKQEENCAEICTGVYPFYHSDVGDVTLSEKIINLPGTFNFVRIVPLDCTQFFDPDTLPTQNELRTAAQNYIRDNKLGVPAVNLTIQYLSIEDSEEAISLHMFENIDLGDEVTIRFEKLGINTKSRCVKYVYDSLLDRVDSIEIGDVKQTFTDTVTKTMNRDMSEVVMSALAKATSLITNGLGGYVRFHKSNPNLKAPDELLILGDSPDLGEAQQVWRWNKSGLGYSDHGYNPQPPYTYKTAMTADGQIVADMITTGVLSAIEIYNHSDSANATFRVTSSGEVFATSGTIGGFHLGANSLYNDCVQLSNTSGVCVRNNGTTIGRVCTLKSGDERNVFGITLANGGNSIVWAVETENGTVPILRYARSSNQLEALVPLNMRNNYIVNLGVNSTVQTSIPVQYISVANHPSDSSLLVLSIQDHDAQYNSQGQFIGMTGFYNKRSYTIKKA